MTPEEQGRCLHGVGFVVWKGFVEYSECVVGEFLVYSVVIVNIFQMTGICVGGM